MPRAQKKRAARAAAASGEHPSRAAPPPRSVAPATAGAAPTQPWSWRSLLVLALLVAALQLPFAGIDWIRDSHRYGYGVYLVASLSPVAASGNLSLLRQLEVLAAFVIVAPVARRLSGEARTMGLLETLSVGAVTLILLAVLWQLALIAGGGHLTQAGHVAGRQLVTGALADAGGLVLGSLAYPPIHRRVAQRMPPRR